MNPIISILVPVYNVEPYIERCLTSILTQTMQDGIELIIVDDCTPDNSIDIAEKVICNTPSHISCRVIRHDTNQGLAATRQTGIRNAIGTYITFVDSDDYISSDYIESLYSYAVAHADCDIVIGDHYRVSNDGKCELCPSTHTANYSDFISMKGKTCVWGNLYKRNLFTIPTTWKNGLNYGEDYLMTIQLMYFSKKVAYINKGIYFYNTSNSSISRKKKYSTKDIDDIIYVASFASNFIREHNINDCTQSLHLAYINFKYSIAGQAMTFQCNRRQFLNLWPEAKDALPTYLRQNKGQFGLLAKPLFYAIAHCNYPLFYVLYKIIKLKKSIIG